MNKRKVVLVGILVAALCFAGFVYALTTLSWTQNPQVPKGSYIVSNATAVIIQDSNQTGIWTWYGDTHSFNATIVIKNDGLSYINVAVARPIDLDVLWIWTPISTQTIAPGDTKPVYLSINKPSASSEEFVGSFTITTAMVP